MTARAGGVASPAHRRYRRWHAPTRLVLAALVLACSPAPAPAPAAAKPAPAPVVAPPTPQPPATPPTVAPVATQPAPPPATPPPPIAGVRDKHPLGGMSECLEMYSACSPDGKGRQTCTSAQFRLACGETGQVPGGGDTLRCVCP